ncbi:MAG: outer membrane protein assembly factor [Chitinophagales bacterium]|nr:outer membrane protein assembly factor [Chitinophagales bacterium]
MHNKIKQHHKILYFTALLFLISCNSTKKLNEGEYLLKSQAVKIEYNEDFADSLRMSKSDKVFFSSELQNMATPVPNKKFLFVFQPRLFFYNVTNRPQKQARRESKGKTAQSKFGNWFKEKLGEAPVLFDSTVLNSNNERMINYLINQGFFNATVKSEYILQKKQAEVVFHAFPSNRFLFNEVIFEIEDPEIEKVVNQNMSNSLIKKGQPYSIDALKGEQERLALVLNNHGFFSFSKNNILYEVDTSGTQLAKNVYLQISRDEDDLARKQYRIGDVSFNINYANTSLKRKNFELDTLRSLYIYHSPSDVRADIIAQSIFYQPDSIFKKDDYQKTINRLTELGIFRFVNIKYKPLLVSETEGYVDTDIVAELRKRQSGKIELEANTDARDKIGTYINLSYVNRNIFRRADRLEFNISNGVEFWFSKIEKEGERNSRISSVNLMTNTRLYFPKIFPDFKKKTNNNRYKPLPYPRNTFMNLGYNLQKKIGYYSYVVNTFNIGYGYDIRGRHVRHEVQPFSMSFIKPRSASFNSNFNEFLNDNPIFAQSYRQQFIMGQEYTFSYNNQDINIGKVKSFFFYRGTINTAGNLVYGIQSLISKKPESGYTLSNIPYASFTKLDNDFRYYFTYANKTTLVARLFAGIGIPYGNSKIMPFVKQYAAGGPQSMRGWSYRQLGPGSTDTSNTSLDLNTGDIQLEFNLEYRYSLSKLMKMALFTDIGNVWLMHADSTKPNAEFNVKRWGQDLAWSAGFGFRLDFGLFVIRLDHSYKLYNPNLSKGVRWISQYPGYDALEENSSGNWSARWKSWRSRYANFVIGIGYPF